MTRDELRADILEITTVVVDRAVRDIRKTATEDILALSQQIDRVDRRLTREIRRTNTLIEAHIADPQAHSRPISA